MCDRIPSLVMPDYANNPTCKKLNENKSKTSLAFVSLISKQHCACIFEIYLKDTTRGRIAT